MKRFIDLGQQYWALPSEDDEKSFAFIDTVRDRFCEFDTEQFWDTREEFTEAFNVDPDDNDIDRYLSLIPKDW